MQGWNLCAPGWRMLAKDPSLSEIGIDVVSVHLANLAPKRVNSNERCRHPRSRPCSAQKADEATFERRALAVDQERAIDRKTASFPIGPNLHGARKRS